VSVSRRQVRMRSATRRRCPTRHGHRGGRRFLVLVSRLRACRYRSVRMRSAMRRRCPTRHARRRGGRRCRGRELRRGGRRFLVLVSRRPVRMRSGTRRRCPTRHARRGGRRFLVLVSGLGDRQSLVSEIRLLARRHRVVPTRPATRQLSRNGRRLHRRRRPLPKLRQILTPSADPARSGRWTLKAKRSCARTTSRIHRPAPS
jgi:hypothetical protein